MAKILYLVIPCYNEEEVLADTAGKLDKKMKELMAEGLIDVKSRIIFVNDGSMDLTWKIIEDLHNKDTLFGGINLTRNRGHQNALLAGLMTVKDDADIVISLDADLQDDINVFEEMLRKNNEGYDVIYGVRNDRKKDSFFKRHTAQMFYKLTNKLGGDLIYNHADFRLMSRRALEGLAQFEEVNLFLRGIVPLIGYPSTIVEYERKERLAGKSKYPLKKMMSFAIEGITSLSIKPMRFVTGMGIFVFLVSIAMMIYAFVSYFTGRVVAGWTSILISVWAIGGMVLLGLGIVGSYIGKIYLETKKRPRYIVEKYINECMQNMGVPSYVHAERLKVEEKIRVVKYLQDKGTFKVKGAIALVADKLDVSEPTIYRYLKKA